MDKKFRNIKILLTLLFVSIVGLGQAENMVTYSNPDLPGFSFSYDADLWRLQNKPTNYQRELLSIVLEHQLDKANLEFSFRLQKETGFVDCVYVFTQSEYDFVGSLVRILNRYAEYQYLDKSSSCFVLTTLMGF